MLSNGSNISRSLAPASATQQQSVFQQQQPTNAQYDEDMGYRFVFSMLLFFLHLYIEKEIIAEKMRKELIVYLLARTMTREDVAIIQERRMSQQSQGTI